MAHQAGQRRAEAIARVDRSHGEGASEESSSSAPPAKLGDVKTRSATEPVLEQVHQQASQLAGHLRHRLYELDQRESQLNARVAAWEHELRSSRLWISEREQQLNEREERLRRAEEELKSRETALAVAEVALQEKERDYQKQRELVEQELEHRVQQLDAQQAQVDRQRIQLDEQQRRWQQHQREQLEQWQSQCEQWEEARRIQLEELVEQQRLLEQQRSAFETRRQQWEQQRRSHERDGEAQLEALQSACRTELKELEQDRQRLSAELEAARRERNEAAGKFEEHQAQWQRDHDRRTAELAERSMRLDRREQALRQLHADTLRIQRETLEMRLIVEELWSRVSDRTEAAQVAQQLTSVRLRVADQFRLLKEELNQRQKDLLDAESTLRQRLEELEQQRTQLQHWFEAREVDLQQQATRLVERERELQAREQRFDEARRQWMTERHQLRQQLIAAQHRTAHQDGNDATSTVRDTRS